METRSRKRVEASSPPGNNKEYETRAHNLGININGGGYENDHDEDDDEDDDSKEGGGVGILHHNLTSASSALQGLLRNLGAGLDDLSPSSAMASASSSHQRFTWYFSVDFFVPVLVGLLNHESNLDIMLLAARALTHLCDVLPSSCADVVHYGVVSCFVARLLTIEYMDLAEHALKKISQGHLTACLQAGALMAVLSYLDFFSTGVQRVVLSTSANMCKKLPSDAADFVMEVVPLLTILIQYHDAKASMRVNWQIAYDIQLSKDVFSMHTILRQGLALTIDKRCAVFDVAAVDLDSYLAGNGGEVRLVVVRDIQLSSESTRLLQSPFVKEAIGLISWLDKFLGLDSSRLKKSMLVVSEFIGCSPSLSGAIRVNPCDIDSVADVMDSAKEAALWTARDKCRDFDVPNFKIKLYNTGGIRGYELPTSETLEGIVFESGSTSRMDYDVFVELKGGLSQRINKLHQSYMSLQFPLLFVFGQSRFHPKLNLKPRDGSGRGKTISMNMYYMYQLHP
ncbi:E3 ubiquitin protein ligase UPL3 [Tanacetum coccineum]